MQERTTAYLRVGFKDKDGRPEAPSVVRYRVDDPETGRAVRASTPVAAAASVEIQLTGDDVTIAAEGDSGKRKVTVIAEYGLSGDRLTQDFDYQLTRMKFVP